MSTTPATHETSLTNRPILRWSLLGGWGIIVTYTVMVLGAVLSPQVSTFQSPNITRILLGLPALIQNILDYGVDILLMFGFSVIAGILIVNRSDDWFAIFTSLFLIVFGARITNLANNIAQTPGYQTQGGLILAFGDIGIVLFSMLFPNGKFTPKWLKYLVPFLFITMLGIYIFPASPAHWLNLTDSGIYFAVTVSWYVIGLSSSIHRYYRASNLAQKQQIRWIFIGTMGPFLWFIIFQVLSYFFPALTASDVAAVSFQTIARLASIFMFLMLPLSVAISIVQTHLFDIDMIINRSLVYGILTIGLGLTFGLVFVLASAIFKSMHANDQFFFVAIVFSVLAGATFQPLRKKLQRFVDRFFYHIKIDYQKTPLEVRAEASTNVEGITLSTYRNLQLIGHGGMAEVYRATDSTGRGTVALKVLRAALAGDEQFQKRFMREAEIISKLDHPNIVHVTDFGEERGLYYIAMEMLSGPDLSRLIKEEKRISLDNTVGLLRGIADALDYAHMNGLVHRDIKPSNIMLDSSTIPSRSVLTDFGIAKMIDAHTRITNTAGMLGTFDYMAPEQIQASADVDGHADIYALGVMTYQMLTGHLPFERPDTGAILLAHMSAPPPDARELVSDIPRAAARAIQQAMAKNIQDRFSSAKEFVAALESA
ncbi:MAG: serine/threonine protein kinase [Anaerolineales bacterium]|nr:serine/threonine protein kinase [Anaerolineales bacterium]